MAGAFDPKELVTLVDLAISNRRETAALIELLERKGILTRQEVLDIILELRQREISAPSQPRVPA